MKKPVVTLVGASVAVTSIALAPAAAQAHGDDGRNHRIEVVKVVDTKRKAHSLITVQYKDLMRGKVVKITADSKLFAGLRKQAGPWITPGEARIYRPVGRDTFTTRLPSQGNRAKIAIPFDVAKRPPTSFAARKADAIRITFVSVVRKSQYSQAGLARIMTVRKGDPANYFWKGNRVSRVWERDWHSNHAHRTIVR